MDVCVFFSLDTSITEDKGFVLETIIAIDVDQGDNAVLTFSLEQTSSDFAIDPNSGKTVYNTIHV